MTSTSFNVGLLDKKSSSRVLKPPGGGHTDIFGINSDTEIVTPSKKRNIPPTTITSCFTEEVDYKEKCQPNNNLEKEENCEQNGNGNIVDENTEPSHENKEDEKKIEQEAPKKTRVPPGGFSSILW